MKSKIIAFTMAVFVLVGSSMTAEAKVCPNSTLENGEHLFTGCKPTLGGRIEDLGYHTYIWGYDRNYNPIYESCHMTQGVQYCISVCTFCGIDQPNGGHEHRKEVQHSASHKNE